MNKEHQKVFLIGAARSGTKILRDVLATSGNIAAIPYDINYIWRWDNEFFPNDELTTDQYTAKTHQKIDNYLDSFRKNNEEFIIEKTVSNTIRIPFLLKHYPNAKFIYLYRNGHDVVESVMRQWTSISDKQYLWNKMKTIPIPLLMNYGIKHFIRNLNKKNKQHYWGVNYPEMFESKKVERLEEIVANQWVYCLSKMMADKSLIPKNNLVEIHYENLVTNPTKELNKLNILFNSTAISSEVELDMIKKGNIGKSNQKLSKEQMEIIDPIISDTVQLLKSQ